MDTMLNVVAERNDLKAVLAENLLLQKQFASWGLNINSIGIPEGENPEQMNWYLRTLTEWVQAYRRLGGRAAMEQKGYLYPPVNPCIDPESDWIRFERWVKHEPLTWNLTAKVQAWKSSRPMDESETNRRIALMMALLAENNVAVEMSPGIPPRLVYDYLFHTLMTEQFEHCGPGTVTHLTGCTGYCPECFQRPWCEMGMEMAWPEDGEAGRMVFPIRVATDAEETCDETSNG